MHCYHGTAWHVCASRLCKHSVRRSHRHQDWIQWQHRNKFLNHDVWDAGKAAKWVPKFLSVFLRGCIVGLVCLGACPRFGPHKLALCSSHTTSWGYFFVLQLLNTLLERSFWNACVQDVAKILAIASPKSLVLIDELGGSTSTTDGLGIAWAVAETLISTGAACLFATHFNRLTALSTMYPNCKLWHFDVECLDTLAFNWKLLPGKCEIEHYGLLLGPQVCTPNDTYMHRKHALCKNCLQRFWPLAILICLVWRQRHDEFMLLTYTTLRSRRLRLCWNQLYQGRKTAQAAQKHRSIPLK